MNYSYMRTSAYQEALMIECQAYFNNQTQVNWLQETEKASMTSQSYHFNPSQYLERIKAIAVKFFKCASE